MSDIDVPKRLRLGGVDRFLSEVDQADDPVTLRFGGCTVENPAADLVTAALLGSMGAKKLTVNLGIHPSSWAESNGLAFALANRQGDTEVRTNPVSDWWGTLSRDWRGTWTSADRGPSARPPLFPASEYGGSDNLPSFLTDQSAAFVNAHLSPLVGTRHPVTTQLWPWLDELLPESGGVTRGSESRRALLSDFGSLIDEAVANVADHAVQGKRRTWSMVRVSITRGGGRRSATRLHLSVLDTGPGIIATARPRLPSRHRERESPFVLKGLFDGSVKADGPAGHGLGLPRMHRLARKYGGSLNASTNDARCEGNFGGIGNTFRAVPTAFNMQGTVVGVTIPVR